MTLLRPLPEHPVSSKDEEFEDVLQLRITQVALSELVDGPETASAKWVELFSWYSQRSTPGIERKRDAILPLPCVVDIRPDGLSSMIHSSETRQQETDTPIPTLTLTRSISPVSEQPAIPINLTPPTPESDGGPADLVSQERPAQAATELENGTATVSGKEKGSGKDKELGKEKGPHRRKKATELLKERVVKGQAHINTISRRIGKTSKIGLHRSNSAPGIPVAGFGRSYY
jgi:hypothetical protein